MILYLHTCHQYNADIPFEKKAAAGFYDTADEQARVAAAPVGQTLRRLENKRKPEEEEAERKKRQRKNAPGKEGEAANHQTKFIAARDAQIQKLKEAESIGRRRKLALPTAQVGETELEDIVKIGQAGENAKALVGGGSDASGRLLSDYEGLEAARMARTPRTAPQRQFASFISSVNLIHFFQTEDTVMMEARNLRNMTIAQTPLLGDENTPLHTGPGGGSGFEGATPRHQVAFTPNPLATPMREGSLDVSATPRLASATPLRTPLRDNLSINPDEYSMLGGTPRDQRLRASSAKRALKTGFLNLPKPENNFELLVPDEEDNEASETNGQKILEDAADRDAQIKRLQDEEERKSLARRSQVVQLGLPRPSNVDISSLMDVLNMDEEEPEMQIAQKLVNAELVQLLQHDSIMYSLPGTTRSGSSHSSYVPPDDHALEAAKGEIHAELASLVGFPSANTTQLREGLLKLSKTEAVSLHHYWAFLRNNLVYDISSAGWVERASLDIERRIAGYSALLNDNRDIMTKEAMKTAKLEKKLGVTLGGYQQRAQAIVKRITTAFEEMRNSKIEYETFARLRGNESATGPRRLTSLQEEVEKLEHRERMLQMRYSELLVEKQDSEARVSVLEEKLMADAEAYNDAQLAATED